MSTFADSSALVKLYSDEPGHEAVRNLDPIAISALARVEVPAALWRKNRTGELSGQHARVLTDEFEADLFGSDDEAPRFAVLACTSAQLDRAARLCAVHGLRAYDAVQLAAALDTRDAEPACAAFAAFDTALRRSAAAEGFSLVPPDVP